MALLFRHGGLNPYLGLSLMLLGLAFWDRPLHADAMSVVILQTIDKVTARVKPMDAPIGEAIHFGTLTVTARHCDKRPPEETPESAAFLEITETKPGEDPRLIFSGWMFASSPALSALDHPVYDLRVIDCKKPVSAPAGSSQ